MISQFGENIILTDLRGGGLDPTNDRIDDNDEIAVIVNAKNLVGDNCLATIKDISERYPQLTILLVNCDLADKVTTGMTERTKRDVFRVAFKQVSFGSNDSLHGR